MKRARSRYGVNALGEERLEEFMDHFQPWTHALEINRLRGWRENQRAATLSWRFGALWNSGGVRHGSEPNALRAVTAIFRMLNHRYIRPALERAMPQTKELG